MYHVLFVICIYIPISCIAFGIKYYYLHLKLLKLISCDYKSLTRIQPVPEISGPPIIKFTAT